MLACKTTHIRTNQCQQETRLQHYLTDPVLKWQILTQTHNEDGSEHVKETFAAPKGKSRNRDNVADSGKEKA